MREDGLHTSNGRHQISVSLSDEPYAQATSQSGQDWKIYLGDSRQVLPRFADEQFNCVVTSPPYFWQRDYKEKRQIGLEPSIAAYVDAIADVMDQVYRVLAKNGLLFLNLGDTYYSRKGQPQGHDRKNWARRFSSVRAVDKKGLNVPRKTAIGMPWRVALEMINRGWTLRSPIVWRRKGSQPEPTAKDRPWRTYEMVFMFSKRPTYHFIRKALMGEEDVWTISTHSKNTNQSMTAFFPEELVRRCLEVGCVPGGRVLDPFAGTGTVLRAALSSGRCAVGIDVSAKLCASVTKSLRTM